ncbi:unnamed protein product [Urochloa humidicola]
MDHLRDDAPQAAWLLRAGLLVLTLSSGAALCRARAAGDAAAAAFVTASYVALLLLLVCLRAYERAPPGEAGGGGRMDRTRIRRAVWSLSTLLTVMFAARVAAVMMPYWPAALLVWGLAAATAVGGFVAMFHRQ